MSRKASELSDQTGRRREILRFQKSLANCLFENRRLVALTILLLPRSRYDPPQTAGSSLDQRTSLEIKWQVQRYK